MRHTHPNLYLAYAAFALLSIALGLNFFFLTPAFMPLSIPEYWIGSILLICGVTKGAALITNRPPDLVRASMALTVIIYSFWAGALAFDFFRLSQTSLQLPLTYAGLAALGLVLLREPYTNPATADHAPLIEETD